MLGRRKPAPQKYYGWDVNPDPTIFELDESARITREAVYERGSGRVSLGPPRIRANPFYYGEVFDTLGGATSALDSHLSR